MSKGSGKGGNGKEVPASNKNVLAMAHDMSLAVTPAQFVRPIKLCDAGDTIVGRASDEVLRLYTIAQQTALGPNTAFNNYAATTYKQALRAQVIHEYPELEQKAFYLDRDFRICVKDGMNRINHGVARGMHKTQTHQPRPS